MRNYHWTLSIALLATAGCHDFTITLDDNDGIGINFGGGVTVAVDDGHDDEATAAESPSVLALTLATLGESALLVPEGLVATVPMSDSASAATGASEWDLTYSNEKGLGISVTTDDIKALFRSTGPTVPPTIEVLDVDGAELLLATYSVSVDPAGNEVLICTPATVGEETPTRSVADTGLVFRSDACVDNQPLVQDVLMALGTDLGLQTTAYGGWLWDACIAKLIGGLIWEWFYGGGAADAYNLSDPACLAVLGL